MLERLAEIDHARGRYQAMTAEGLMTFDELEARLDELGASRRVTQRELRAARDRHRRHAGADHLLGPIEELRDVHAHDGRRHQAEI